MADIVADIVANLSERCSQILTLFYYKEKKISWTTTDEVRNRTKQAVKKGKVLLFHWRGGYLTKEILKELLEALTEAATEKGKYLRVSLN